MKMLYRLGQFLAKPVADDETTTLYHACVGQARQVTFYESLGVPDTVDGRFDMLLLHIVLVMHRLQSPRGASQKLFDLLFADMDRSLREMGVGDMSVGKKIAPMIQAFYGRAKAYQQAFDQSGGELALALQRNIYGATVASDADIKRMTDYVRRTVVSLAGQDSNAIARGVIIFSNI
jgi:cytochrome b pre-mRNA-processing protein 3